MRGARGGASAGVAVAGSALVLLGVSACGSQGETPGGPDAAGTAISDAGIESDTGAAPDATKGTGGADGGGLTDGGQQLVDAGVDAAMEDASGDASAAIQAHANADDAVEAMLLNFWDQNLGYLDAVQHTSGATGYWTFQQAWDAVLDAVERHGGARFTGTLRTLYNAQNAIGWSRDYYDDENWATLALIHAYDLTGDAIYLTEAETLYADIMGAWDTTCCGAVPGGLWWDRAHTQKATASNAGAALSGALLYSRANNDATYLTFAQQAFAFWNANMVNPTTHQVTDHITAAGQMVAWKFTYNEGLMIGAAVALDQASGDAGTIAVAEPIASFVLGSETEASALGMVLTDGPDSTCGSNPPNDCMQFKGIAARYMAALYQADPKPAYLALLTQSAAAAWTIARDPSSGLFGTDWGEPFSATAEADGAPSPGYLNASSSAAMALAAAAIVQGSAAPDPVGVYEAEESVLHSVGLEATYGAFEGWGYVAGWGAVGEGVDFLVTAPSAGLYDLTFRYAAEEAGNASRLLTVNGANPIVGQAEQPFASTGSWATYATVTVTVTLAPGLNTVSLTYDSSSANDLNLDQLSVLPH